MLRIRRADEVHHEAGGWFDARWHFSFDRYRDPENMGLGALRVFTGRGLAELILVDVPLELRPVGIWAS